MINDRVEAWVERLNASLEPKEARPQPADLRYEGEALGEAEPEVARAAADDASEDTSWW
jgi:hypothetical protein